MTAPGQELPLYDEPGRIVGFAPEADGAVVRLTLSDVEVLVSSDDCDNIFKNMITVRDEERTALAGRNPDAFVYID